MRDCIVNGQKWKDCLEQLKAAKPKKDNKMKFEFVPIEEYMKLLDNVIGVSNYTVEYTMPQYGKITSGQDFLYVKCRITVIDDDGNMVIFKEGLGASEFAYSSENNGRDVNLKNSPVYAQQSAFKTAAKDLGCFDFYGTYREGKDSEADSSKGGRQGRAQTSRRKLVTIKARTNGAYFVAGENARGEKTLKLPVVVNGEKNVSELIFYPNNIKDYKDEVNGLLIASKKGSKALSVSVYECDERDGRKQYVFKSFVA